MSRSILAAHHHDVRIIELVGTLTFSNVDYVSRQLAAKTAPATSSFSTCAASQRSPAPAPGCSPRDFANSRAFNVTVILSGINASSPTWQAIGEWTEGITNLRNFHLLDDAIEWAEDQIVYRHGGAIDFLEMTELSEQPLLAGLTRARTDRSRLDGHDPRTINRVQKIIAAGDPPVSLFFLKSGVVHVTAARAASGSRRSPREWRLAKWRCWNRIAPPTYWRTYPSPPSKCRSPISSAFASSIREVGERIMRNLAQLLADRLIVANTKVNLLTAN